MRSQCNRYLRQGMASLTLVLIVVTLISLIMLPIFLVTYIRNTQAVRFYHSQQAFFAAEGAYAETVARIKSHPSWITAPGTYIDTYSLIPNTIHRSITLDSGIYYIDITADNRLAQRKIEGVFTPATITTSTYYDLVLVMDYSTSMNEFCSPGLCPIDLLKPAAAELLNRFRHPNNRVGMVIFNQSATSYDFDYATNTHIDSLIDDLTNRSAGGSTNLSDGLYQGMRMLNDIDIDDPDRERVMILFSDGVPNNSINIMTSYPRAWCANPWNPSVNQPCACDNNECTEPESSFITTYDETIGGNRVLYKPGQDEGTDLEHYGSFCTNQAIQIARDAKNNPVDTDYNITIYSVFLQNAPKAFCKTYSNIAQPTLSPSNPTDMALAERVIALGRLTNFFISSETNPYNYSNTTDYEYYKEATTADELYDIFSNIGDTISSGGSSTYSEAVPD